MNWYVKRLGLAYVYKLSELFYIQDTSPDHRDTWEFLCRRIADLRSTKEAKVRFLSCHFGANFDTLILVIVFVYKCYFCLFH